MKRNIINGIILISALALGSCSTSKLASNQLKDDDVYFSEAKAGDQPVYVAESPKQNNNPYNQNSYNDYNDDDYYYYDSYSSRINRFGYYSPFSYYDSYYDGYYGGYYGYNPYFGGGFGYGGYGYGLGGYYGFYNPYYFGGGLGFGYGLGYNYFGGGYGYGNGGGYWGVYSANRSSGIARPYRAQMPNVPGAAGRTGGGRIGYSGNYPNAYMGRPQRNGTPIVNGNGQTIRTTSYGRNGSSDNYSRPQRPTQDAPRPTQPQVPQVDRSYSPPPSNSGGGGDGGRSSGGGGGGGGRPVRP
jgi:hypothetical protein